MADLHMPIRVGSDIAFLNGLMNVLIDRGPVPQGRMSSPVAAASRISRKKILEYPPERAAEISGIRADTIRYFADVWLRQTRHAHLLSGITEHTCGVNNVLSCANLQMILGNVGFECGGINPYEDRTTSRAPATWGRCRCVPGISEGGRAPSPGQIREGLGRADRLPEKPG